MNTDKLADVLRKLILDAIASRLDPSGATHDLVGVAQAHARQALRYFAAAPQPPAQPSADAVSIAAEISTRPEFAKYEAPLILDIVRETLKAARAAEGGKS